jgi:hypothetical protein
MAVVRIGQAPQARHSKVCNFRILRYKESKSNTAPNEPFASEQNAAFRRLSTLSIGLQSGDSGCCARTNGRNSRPKPGNYVSIELETPNVRHPCRYRIQGGGSNSRPTLHKGVAKAYRAVLRFFPKLTCADERRRVEMKLAQLRNVMDSSQTIRNELVAETCQ